jgi:hypothetical protein
MEGVADMIVLYRRETDAETGSFLEHGGRYINGRVP